jgi:hypothetical protein
MTCFKCYCVLYSSCSAVLVLFAGVASGAGWGDKNAVARLDMDIDDCVRTCRECQLNKPATQPPAPPVSFPIPKTPFEAIILDWVGPLPKTARGCDFLLNVTDKLTTYAIPIPCQQPMSGAVTLTYLAMF